MRDQASRRSRRQNPQNLPLVVTLHQSWLQLPSRCLSFFHETLQFLVLRLELLPMQPLLLLVLRADSGVDESA